MNKNAHTYKLTEAQNIRLHEELSLEKYEKTQVPHTSLAVKTPHCNINLYNSGKLLIQGKGAKDWVEFTLEPIVLQEVTLNYEKEINPEISQAHMGIDESGKGDFLGPLVIASAYIDEELYPEFIKMGVTDSKAIKSDKKIKAIASDLRQSLGNRYSIVKVGNERYNELYKKFANLNKLLAWGHATAIENLLEIIPDCPRALSDKFGPENRIKSALKEKGRKIILDQKVRGESDPAVAAASILARDGFVQAMDDLSQEYGIEFRKGVSPQVKTAAQELIKKYGPEILQKTAKCHFKTCAEVLAEEGYPLDAWKGA